MKRALLAAWVCATCWCAAPHSAHAQAPTFRAGVESVRIDALITDGGRPLADLTADDFEVFDNGERQTIDYVSVDKIPLNLVLALDRSESVAGDALTRLREAGRAALSGLRPEDQAALLTFGDALAIRSPLTADLAHVRDALSNGDGAGYTALIDAAYASMWIADGDPARALAIVFSDGMDTSSLLRPERVLEGARRTDLVVYGVTLDRSRNNSFLSELSETTGGRVFALQSAGDLAATFTEILEEFRHRYVISYTPKTTSRPGWHELDVRVKGRRAKVTARRGYLSGPS